MNLNEQMLRMRKPPQYQQFRDSNFTDVRFNFTVSKVFHGMLTGMSELDD
jgi:hypothetical protein